VKEIWNHAIGKPWNVILTPEKFARIFARSTELAVAEAGFRVYQCPSWRTHGLALLTFGGIAHHHLALLTFWGIAHHCLALLMFGGIGTTIVWPSYRLDQWCTPSFGAPNIWRDWCYHCLALLSFGPMAQPKKMRIENWSLFIEERSTIIGNLFTLYLQNLHASDITCVANVWTQCSRWAN
jgi:hypothetical protein